MRAIERFKEKTKRSGECIIWTGKISAQGYGYFYYFGKYVRAHRWAYALANGTIPAGLFVCHKCDNRKCVKLDHLFLGTHQDNMDDMKRKGRQYGKSRKPPTQCKRKHEFTHDNLFKIKNGSLRCKKCSKLRKLFIRIKSKLNKF